MKQFLRRKILYMCNRGYYMGKITELFNRLDNYNYNVIDKIKSKNKQMWLTQQEITTNDNIFTIFQKKLINKLLPVDTSNLSGLKLLEANFYNLERKMLNPGYRLNSILDLYSGSYLKDIKNLNINSLFENSILLQT